MRCSWETVRTFSQNDKQLQGTPGAIAVLHTNTRPLARIIHEKSLYKGLTRWYYAVVIRA
jgi:hypothetical protein